MRKTVSLQLREQGRKGVNEEQGRTVAEGRG